MPLPKMRRFTASMVFLFIFTLPTLLTSAQPASQSAENFNAIWSTIATTNTPTERHENGFVAHGNKLYLLGGRGLKRVEIFDPETDTWSNGAFPNFQMHHFQALEYNDLIYVIGAYSGTCCDAEFGVSHVWTYNPNNDSWTQQHEIPEDRRRGSTGAVAYNNKIYIVGGLDGGHGAPATAYAWFDEYDPATGQWKVLPDAPRVRDHFHASVYNGKLYLIGGRNSSVSSVTGAPIAEIDVYDFGTSTWSTLPSSQNLPTPRGGPSTIFYQGEILVIGGETSQVQAHGETEAFNPNTGEWRDLAPLVVGRHGTQAAVFDDAIYLPAGSAQKGGSPELDSIERYEDATVQLVQRTQSLQPGWNLLGLPLAPLNFNTQNIYNNVTLGADQEALVWNQATGYEPAASLSIGRAYWLNADDNMPTQNQTITGTTINAVQVPLTTGWNMVSGPSCDNIILLGSSTDPTGAIPENSLYYFNQGYEPAYSNVFHRGRMQEGVGYWAYATKDAMLNLQCGPSKTGLSQHKTESLADTFEESGISQTQVSELLGKLSIHDGANKSRELLFNGASQPDLDPDAFNLPPRTYQGYFDARFSNDRRLVEGLNGHMLLQASELPLTITFNRTPQERSGYLRLASRSGKTYEVEAGQSVEINEPGLQVVEVQFIPASLTDIEKEQPESFALHGNYPNPFNPSTRISFDLPVDAQIELTVYDILGKEVLQHNAGFISAGTNRSVSLDAGHLPAGTYIYKVKAHLAGGTTQQTGRMVLLK